MLRVACCCALFELSRSKCMGKNGGTTTLCSSLGQSQCMTSDLCTWDASAAASPLASPGCKYLYYLNSSGSDLYEDEKAACAVLDTKETCQSVGSGVGNYGCRWWDVDHCSVDNLSVVFKPFWGCNSPATCESVFGYWCSICTPSDLAFIWRDSGHYTPHLLLLASEGRGKCIDECAKAKTTNGLEANKRLCDKIAGCGFSGVDGGTCFEIDDARHLGFGLPFLAVVLAAR